MEKQAFKIGVKPEIFKWLFSTSGYRIEGVSAKLKIPSKTLEKWLSGEDKPTLGNVKELSKIFNRSLAVFLLSKPPEEMPLPKDRRSVKEAKPLSLKTYKAMRIARWIYQISSYSLSSPICIAKPKIEHLSQFDNPEVAAQHLRNAFGVKVEDQHKWKELIENNNIIVLQSPIPVEETHNILSCELFDKYLIC